MNCSRKSQLLIIQSLRNVNPNNWTNRELVRNLENQHPYESCFTFILTKIVSHGPVRDSINYDSKLHESFSGESIHNLRAEHDGNSGCKSNDDCSSVCQDLFVIWYVLVAFSYDPIWKHGLHVGTGPLGKWSKDHKQNRSLDIFWTAYFFKPTFFYCWFFLDLAL